MWTNIYNRYCGSFWLVPSSACGLSWEPTPFEVVPWAQKNILESEGHRQCMKTTNIVAHYDALESSNTKVRFSQPFESYHVWHSPCDGQRFLFAAKLWQVQPSGLHEISAPAHKHDDKDQQGNSQITNLEVRQQKYSSVLFQVLFHHCTCITSPAKGRFLIHQPPPTQGWVKNPRSTQRKEWGSAGKTHHPLQSPWHSRIEVILRVHQHLRGWTGPTIRIDKGHRVCNSL